MAVLLVLVLRRMRRGEEEAGNENVDLCNNPERLFVEGEGYDMRALMVVGTSSLAIIDEKVEGACQADVGITTFDGLKNKQAHRKEQD